MISCVASQPVELAHNDAQVTSLPCKTKDEAKACAALAACKYLHQLGVLDDNLHVAGRARLQGSLFARSAGHSRPGQGLSLRRLNQYLLHTAVPAVRRLPRFLQPVTAEAGTDGVDAMVWWTAPWMHRLELGGRDSELLILCPHAAPPRLEFIVGHRPNAQPCRLTPLRRVALSQEQRDLLCRWRVGQAELVQAAAAGEPSHPTLEEPSRLMRFERATGSFVPDVKPFAPPPPCGGAGETAAGETAAASARSQPVAIERWLAAKALGADGTDGHTELSDIITQLIRERCPPEDAAAPVPMDCTGAAAPASEAAGASAPASAAVPPAAVLVIDLDHTLWRGACADFAGADWRECQVRDEGGLRSIWMGRERGYLHLHDAVPLVLRALERAKASLAGRLTVAVASLSPAVDTAMMLLRKLGHADALGPLQIGPPPSGEPSNSNKRTHLKQIALETCVPLSRLVLLDDDAANVRSARDLGCSAVLLDPDEGLSVLSVLAGLEQLALKHSIDASPPLADVPVAVETGEVSAGGLAVEPWRKADDFNADERAILEKEKRRKALQSREGAEEAHRARCDAGPAAAKLASLEALPACYMIAPLKRSTADAPDIDWGFVRLGCELFASCDWPTLAETHHPLVELTPVVGTRVSDVADGAGESSIAAEAPPEYELATCALAYRKPLNSRAIVLTNVVVHCGAEGGGAEGDGGGSTVVSGQYRPRTFARNLRVEVEASLGEKWSKARGRPTDGEELECAALRSALEGGTTEFERASLEGFGLVGAALSWRSCIQVGGVWWRPTERVWRTIASDVDSHREGGYTPAEVRAIPLRKAHLPALQSLRRILWRLESVALVVEEAAEGAASTLPPTDVASTPSAAATPPRWWPAGAQKVPLPMLCQALTHKSAAAEGLDCSLRVPRNELTGSADLEELEWGGDAALRLLCVLRTMSRHDLGRVGERELSPTTQILLQNITLSKRAQDLGYPSRSLARPFATNERLPELRRQLITRKAHADVVEALLGAIVEAQLPPLSTPPAPLPDTALLAALEAGKAYYDGCVHPVETGPAAPSTCVQIQKTMPFTHGKAVERDLGPDERARYGQIALRLHPILLDRPAARHAHLLCECLQWSGEVPFQRLEFLGDAALQYAVSVEVRRHWPTFDAGELTTMRSALVSNRHLGGLLVRRFGTELANGFFTSLPGATRATIATFVADVATEPISPGVALLAAYQRDQLRDGQYDETQQQHKRTAAAAVSEGTFRNNGTAEESVDKTLKKLGDVYEALCGAVLLMVDGDLDAWWRIIHEDFFPHPSDRQSASSAEQLAHLMQTQRQLAATRKAVRKARSDEERDQVREELKRLRAEEQAAVDAVIAAEKRGEIEERPRLLPTPPPASMTPPPPAAPPLVVAPLLPAAPSHGPPDGPSQPHPDLTDGGAAAQAAAEAAAALEQTANAELFINKVLEKLDQARLPRPPSAESPLEETSIEGGAGGPPLFSVTVRHKRSNSTLGEAHGHRGKKAAKKVAYMHTFRNPLLDEVIAIEKPPPQPQLMTVPSAAPAVDISVSQQVICEILGEHRNPGFQRKLAKLMTESREDDAVLVALAQSALALSVQGGHSAGRRFHDEVKAMCDTAVCGDLFLTSADMEPILDGLPAHD